MEPHTLALVLGAALAASAIQSYSGFGFGLVIVPLLALVLGPHDAVVVSNILATFQAGMVLAEAHGNVAWGIGTRAFLGALAGMPVGVLVLAAASSTVLQVIISVAVLLATAAVVGRVQSRFEGRRADVGVGVVSGVLRTSTSMSGPPVVLYLQGLAFSPPAFRATLAGFFAATGVVAVGVLAASRQIDGGDLAASAIGVPAVLAGFFAGSFVFRRAPEAAFRRVVIAILVLSAIAGLVRAAI